MLGGKKIAVVVPAFNEERLISRALSRVPEYVDSVVVVDDASTDSTYEACREAEGNEKIVLLRHETNTGVGGAIVTGYRRAVALKADVIAVMAGDAQMDPADLEGLLGPVVQGDADYSKGDRLSFPGVFKAMPFFRFVGNHVLSVMTRLTSGYREVRDSQCGYTAVSARILGRLDMGTLYCRYGFPNDLLAHLHSAGARLCQVPVRPIYADEVSGISWFTALFRVPFVLLRSFVQRRRREVRGQRVLEQPRRA